MIPLILNHIIYLARRYIDNELAELERVAGPGEPFGCHACYNGLRRSRVKRSWSLLQFKLTHYRRSLRFFLP